MILKNFFKILLVLIVAVTMFRIFPSANASSFEFQHIINAQYDIKDNGDAYVEYQFKTTNKLRNNYLRSFTLTLPFEPLNIRVEDSETKIKIKELSKISATNIYKLEIEMLAPIYGYDKSFNWRFSFDLKSMVLEHGAQKTVTIPTFENDPNIAEYSIQLSMPKALGEISHIYGNSGLQERIDRYFLSFSKGSNLASSVIVLIGKDQEYAFKSKQIEEKTLIPLPTSNPLQNVSYTEFPSRVTYAEQDIDLNYIELQKDEKVSGVIKTLKAEDTVGVNIGKEQLSTLEFIDRIAKGITIDINDKTKTAELLYQALPNYFTIGNSRINADTKIELKEDKKELNPLEVNKIYREFLSIYNIESRGVYGYAFPIQPFKRTDSTAERHVWTEAWLNDKWVTIDPTWLITSKGVNYFESNAYHHIKFGNYTTYEELGKFIASSESIEILPLLQNQNVLTDINLKITIDRQGYSNKEVRLTIFNNSAETIYLKNIGLNLNNLNGVALEKNSIDLNQNLFPNSTLYLTIPLKYGIFLFGKEGKVAYTINYSSQKNEEEKLEDSSNLFIQSNISNYLSIGFLILVSFFGVLSVLVLSFYKRKSSSI